MPRTTIAAAYMLGFHDLVARCRHDKRGNVSITYAFALVPLLGILGLGSDWYRAQSYNKRLQSAADAAAIAAVTTAKAYIVANPKDANASANAITNGKAQAARVFAVNAGSSANTEPVTPTINFPPPIASNSTYSATVSYSTTMPTLFGKLPGFNTPTFPLSGTSTSSVTIGLYLDFYVAVDVSGSMGIPTTTDGQTLLASKNPDSRSDYPTGCVFACHYSGSQGYAVAGQNHIALRIDTVGQALSAMITTAGQQATNNGVANEYRIGLYPFIVHAVDAAPLSANFTQAQSVANSLGTTYLDQGWNNNTQPTSSNGTQIGSGGTHWENLSNDITSYVKPYGNGLSALNPKPFFFIVTDGVDNNQTYPFNGSQPQLPNTSVCDYAKQYQFTVAVLYIPYVPISNPNSNFAGNEDGQTNAVIPQVPSTLQSCASPGFYFTASSPADIQNAMQTMFFQAVQSARLTQ